MYMSRKTYCASSHRRRYGLLNGSKVDPGGREAGRVMGEQWRHELATAPLNWLCAAVLLQIVAIKPVLDLSYISLDNPST